MAVVITENGTRAPRFSARISPRDLDLARRVKNYLIGHKMPALREIEIEADNGTVVLRGEVPSFFQKQLCINCCHRVAGVIRLVDELEVVFAARRPRDSEAEESHLR